MDAIHINWTKPFRNRFNVPYEVEDFEILTTILSALKWREKNGNIKMVTDSIGAQYYKKTGLDVIWNSVENILDNVDVNSNVFWAAGKIFALKEQNAPVAMIDTDFVVWETKKNSPTCRLSTLKISIRTFIPQKTSFIWITMNLTMILIGT